VESNLHMIWQIEMLKQGIPDPSVVAQGPLATDASGDKDRHDNLQDEQIENFADAVFVAHWGCLLAYVLSHDVAFDW
jgi:hypothetical protein